MRCRTKARRPARSSDLKRHALGRLIRSGTTRVQQKFHSSSSCCRKHLLPCYTLLKKQITKNKARRTIRKADPVPALALSGFQRFKGEGSTSFTLRLFEQEIFAKCHGFVRAGTGSTFLTLRLLRDRMSLGFTRPLLGSARTPVDIPSSPLRQRTALRVADCWRSWKR